MPSFISLSFGCFSFNFSLFCQKGRWHNLCHIAGFNATVRAGRIFQQDRKNSGVFSFGKLPLNSLVHVRLGTKQRVVIFCTTIKTPSPSPKVTPTRCQRVGRVHSVLASLCPLQANLFRISILTFPASINYRVSTRYQVNFSPSPQDIEGPKISRCHSRWQRDAIICPRSGLCVKLSLDTATNALLTLHRSRKLPYVITRTRSLYEVHQVPGRAGVK